MRKAILFIAGLTLAGGMAQAHGDEGKHMSDEMSHNPCSMQSMKGMNPCNMQKGSFMKKEVIDGYDVSFHVMKAPEGMEHGGAYQVMVKVEQNNEIIALKAMNSKVTHPNDESESKMMMKMGDWYMAGYDLGHAGEHKIMILFKTEDGKKHFGGISFPNK